MSASSLYLCVDCGGTKTSAVICDAAGQIVGRALGGPCNFSYLGLQPFVSVVRTTVEKALSSSSVWSNDFELSTIGRFTSVWIGVSGADSPNDVRTLTSALSPIFGIPPGNGFQVTNDANLLASPLRVHANLKSAVTVIAGTGSIVVSFSRGDEHESQGQGPAPLKEMARAGGWGWILGDIGSGFDVGREALREILARADRHSVEGRPAQVSDPKSLQSRILSHFGITYVPDLFSVIYAPDPLPPHVLGTPLETTITPVQRSGEAVVTADHMTPDPRPTSLLPRERRLSQLTPLVFEAAFKDGDELALTVVKRCAGSLAYSVASVLVPHSKASSAPRNAVEASSSVLCLGGSLVGVAAYRNLVLEELARLGHVFAVVEFVGEGDVATAGAKGLAVAGNL